MTAISTNPDLTRTKECPNPYCENGQVRCNGGIEKGAYWVICRICHGTGKKQT